VASEVTDALERLDAAADALEATPLGQMTLADLQRWRVELLRQERRLGVLLRVPRPRCGLLLYLRRAPSPPSEARGCTPIAGKTIAVARDAAFCFIYAANLDCLRAIWVQSWCFSRPWRCSAARVRCAVASWWLP
jgi:cobyrinic acid a,c-diamide synthase